MKRYRGPSKGDKLQAAGFLVLLVAAGLADGLFTFEPLILVVGVLTGMVLVGGYLILRACA